MARKLTIDTSIATDIKSAASDSFKDNIKMIAIEKIKESMDNFYSLSDIDILAEDIERQGLKHNLVVVEDSDIPDTYFIKSGHRRFTAIKQLISDGKYTSKYVPCLVDGTKTKDENILDLIMLNATTRVMSDSELFRQYEVLKETLERLKADGVKVKGRLREKVAEALNISSAQVGKIENIKHNAVDEVKEAVKNGDMTIATADSIAKLTVEEQTEIVAEKPVSEITTKDVKERTEKKNKSRSEESNTQNGTDNFTEESDGSEDIESSDEIEEISETSQNIPKREAELLSWAKSLSKEQINYLCDGGWYNSTINGYLIKAAEKADFSREQITALLDGLKEALSDNNKDDADDAYYDF